MVIKSKGAKMKEFLKYAEEQIIDDNNTNKDILKHYLNQIEYVSIQYGKYLEGGNKMDKETLIKNKAKIKAIVSNECDLYTNTITTNEVVGDNIIKTIFNGEEYDIKCSFNRENCDKLPFYIVNARVYKDNLLVKESHMEIDK